MIEEFVFASRLRSLSRFDGAVIAENLLAMAVGYKSLTVDEDIETAPFLIDSLRQQPRKRMSGEHYQKLKRWALYGVLLLLTVVMQANYLVSKCYLYYQHPAEVLRKPWLILLVLCECIYLMTSILTLSDHLLPPSTRPDLGLLDLRSAPTVDIFIPTCKEPTDVPMEAVKAALAIDYPADRMNVFVLDDGGDDELRRFCEGERVVYIRREKRKGVPHNFKCGNMNNGLKFSEAEYVVMMDADMILHPSYLRRVLPHIVNTPDVCFVQVPQAFYNLPSGDPLNDSCIMGYQR